MSARTMRWWVVAFLVAFWLGVAVLIRWLL
jgi:hypothetical protein